MLLILNLIIFTQENFIVSQNFEAGDFLIFQLESGYGLLRILAINTDENGENIWHLSGYNELFPDYEYAEVALNNIENLTINLSHVALTNRAFERTPASRIGNFILNETELEAYNIWEKSESRLIEDRSALQLMGFVR